MSVVNNNTKAYGDEEPVPVYTVEGNVVGENLTGTPGRVEGENVKRYAYTLGDLAEKNPNYDITVEGTLTIYAKEVELEWGNDQALTYNGEAQLPTATVTNLKAGDECNVIVVADENDNATDAGNHTAVAVSLSNANYKLPAAANCAHPYTIAQASHENVANALTISVSANGVQDGKADLSACIPEGAMWSVKACDGTFITAASEPAESSKDRTLTYTAAKAGADVTGGSVTIEISTTNYATYTATVTFATSDVFTLTFLDSKSGEVVDTRRLHEGVEYGTLPDMSRDFYTFDGWYDSASAGTKVTDKTVMGAGDATVFARWTANEYKVALNKGDHGEIPAEYQQRRYRCGYPEGVQRQEEKGPRDVRGVQIKG